jgi:diketogulonate reductase-like aldo/keto reductase
MEDKCIQTKKYWMEIFFIGLGIYQIRKKNEFVNSIKEAYKERYRLLDTAVMYLPND